MKSRYRFIIAITVIAVFCMTTFMASILEAKRGGRGGGRGGSRGGAGFSRKSPAAGGGFSSRQTKQPREISKSAGNRGNSRGNRDDSREDRQENRDDARDDRQEHRRDMQDDRQDFVEDEWDDHHHNGGAAFVAGAVVGAAIGSSTNYVTHIPCTTTVFVDQVTYYRCDHIWYSRGSHGGEVVYIVTSAPAGY